MNDLQLEQRAVLTLFANGCAHGEIAEILDIPVGTVWSRLHAGRKRLREVLGSNALATSLRRLLLPSGAASPSPS